MATVTLTTTIARSAEDIFDLLADVSRNPEWCPGFVHAQRVTSGPLGPGAEFHAQARGIGALQLRIIDHEPPIRLTFLGKTRPAEIEHSFVLSPAGTKTQVRQRITVRPQGRWRLAAPLITALLKRNITANTAALTAFLQRSQQSIDTSPRRD